MVDVSILPQEAFYFNVRFYGFSSSTFGCFSFVFRGIMARTDWLGGVETGFGKAVLGVTLNFGVYFEAWMGWQGWTGEDGGAQRTARIGRGKGEADGFGMLE